MDALAKKMQWTYDVFNSLDRSKKYQICFSGGKDSHLLAGIYSQWTEITGDEPLDLNIVFADTLLEPPMLYSLVSGVEANCKLRNIGFRRVSRSLDQDFWVQLFGRGRPVPSFVNRWCTGALKIKPMATSGVLSITGSHLGESPTRDKRLNSCGSLDCGLDLISNTIEPVSIWSNCDVWDWLGIYGDTYLGEGAFNKLDTLYKVASKELADSKNGSLRMGCFCCPVVALSSIERDVAEGIVGLVALRVRSVIESLRSAPRLLAPKTGNDGRLMPGAIRVDERIVAWEKLRCDFPELKASDWISDGVIKEVDRLLSLRAYPITYTSDWIALNEPRAKKPSWLDEDEKKEGGSVAIFKTVRDRQQGQCLECREPFKKMKYHFIDYDLANVSVDNVVMLCAFCHKKIAKAKGCDIRDVWEYAMKDRLVELNRVSVENVFALW